MNISVIAKRTGLSAKSIRLYEKKGIISSPTRNASGYRQYTDKQLGELNLIYRAKKAGFSLLECKDLVELAHSPMRTSSEVKVRTCKKLQEIEAQIEYLIDIKAQLQQWISSCPGNEQQNCPIIDELIK
ncbi:Cu(I)-responsive transcriptional regulator [Vibrio sagamiensis]|uniref:HTH-type transcriptional regulator CueR n=1 Tax=Vibrio sagamiensis NBRC 104589 TaxID=1219064 RepID=A0A511QEQ6_9VIBR|nr:Cu(I)-responsive transcriptional regulator [Vibrio sagamiensis]PNQ53722.1 Cu(I)-responsive transcriptional regulator [Vibrio agarivorans]GEM75785.1 Cu(I)-responsive transcriptional regulator [Vibrio sagamiensis NBRC 104589]